MPTTLISDDFNRDDNQDLGGNWQEFNEILDPDNGTVLPSGQILGASYFQVENGTLQLEYVQPSGLPSPDQHLSRMNQPYVTQELGTDVRDLGFGMNFTVSPDQWEGFSFFAGAMDASTGFVESNDTRDNSANGFGIFVGRTSQLFSNSVIEIIYYVDGQQFVGDQFPLPFQFEDSGQYDISFEIDASGNYTINVSDGQQTFSASGQQTIPDITLDQFVLNDWRGGLGFSNPSSTLNLEIDDLSVYSVLPPAPIQTIGTNGGDTIDGGAGNDELSGRRGDDLINGLSGDDELRGGRGQDTVLGGLGDDTIAGGRGRDDLSGGADNDEIRGNRGEDTIDGGLGNDFLFGGRGRDEIDGGEGNDTINGGRGRDTIDGGTGDDLLFGNQGADSFVFAPGDGSDVIGDFNVGADVLILEGGHTILNLTEVDTDAIAGADSTLVEFADGSSVLLTSVLGVTDFNDLL